MKSILKGEKIMTFMEFEVIGIQAIAISDGVNSYSARIWGHNPHEIAFVRAGTDWKENGRFFGQKVRCYQVVFDGKIIMELRRESSAQTS